ncbi:MAG: dihydroorotase, partial [Actinobacteria bacterium]|nr:dihydroorotase [Actinomycetota bacterium]
VVGAPANIALFDITRSWRVDRDLVASRSRNTPFHGMELPGVARLTMLRGKISFESGSSQ